MVTLPLYTYFPSPTSGGGLSHAPNRISVLSKLVFARRLQNFVTVCVVRRESQGGLPLRHLGARRFENPRQLAAGPALGIQNDRLQTLGHPVSAFSLGFSAQAYQTAMGPGVQSQQAGNQGNSSWEGGCHSRWIVSLYLCADV